MLELGIGTGRLALPLSARGQRVSGSSCRRTWWRSCARHAGADAIECDLGDIASAQVEGGWRSFALAYLVRNTIMNLTTQDAQVACFANAAWHICAAEGASSWR